MKKLIIVILAVVLSGCVNYAEIAEQRDGEQYLVDRVSYGGYAIVRERNYGDYFLIRFDRIHRLVPADRINVRTTYKSCIEKVCKAWVNGFHRYINISVFYVSEDKYKTYDVFEQIIKQQYGYETK